MVIILKDGLKMEKEMKIPNHIAIIVDGNGRWAVSRGKAVVKDIRPVLKD